MCNWFLVIIIGYGADVKTEDWSTRDRSQQYGNEQSYGKPNNSYDSAFDSFADGYELL